MTDEPGASTALPSDASAARQARRFLASVFEQWDLGLPPFDLLLVTSELVTNAVVHGTPPVVLHLSHDGGEVRVAVGDGGSGDPVARAFTDDLGGGRGLSIVEELSTAWGVEAGHGKWVWATVSLEPAPRHHDDDGRRMVDA